MSGMHRVKESYCNMDSCHVRITYGMDENKSVSLS